MNANDQAKRALELAVCNLLRPPSGQEAQPFFASLCMELTRVAVDADWFGKHGLQCATACTDGRSLYYFPPFINELSPSLVKSLLLHEVLHCALKHNTRRGDREPVKWNVACDFVVNSMIKNQCKSEVGADWLLDAKYDGMGAEAVYALLPVPPPQPKGDAGEGNGSGQPGHVIDAASSGADAKVVEKEWEVKIVNAAKCCGQGSVPAAFRHLIDEILNPKVPWQVLLRRFVQSVSQSDYTWSRPNRRYNWQGLFLPSLRSERIGSIAMAIDTSGSTESHWPAFLDESQAILDQCQPDRLLYLQCDCAVARKAEYMPGDTIERLIGGGGGSSSLPIWEAIAQEPEMPLVCCYLTDGDLEFPDVAPAYPVLWIMTTDVKPPFGEIIRMN